MTSALFCVKVSYGQKGIFEAVFMNVIKVAAVSYSYYFFKALKK